MVQKSFLPVSIPIILILIILINRAPVYCSGIYILRI
jgi:hypothetical protein